MDFRCHFNFICICISKGLYTTHKCAGYCQIPQVTREPTTLPGVFSLLPEVALSGLAALSCPSNSNNQAQHSSLSLTSSYSSNPQMPSIPRLQHDNVAVKKPSAKGPKAAAFSNLFRNSGGCQPSCSYLLSLHVLHLNNLSHVWISDPQGEE